jgi:hypothetical protein
MNNTNGRSIKTTLSDSLPDGHLNSSNSLPTTSVVSLRGVPKCFFASDSAEGCIVSRLCKHMRTKEIATGADMPVRGLISTFPSIRGYGKLLSANAPSGIIIKKLTSVAEIPGYPTRKLLFGGPETLTKAAILSRAHAGATARSAPR